MAVRQGGGIRFTIPINIVHSSTDLADTAPFACLAVTAGYYFRLENYDLTLEWNLAAGVTSALAGWKLSRFTTATPAGGTAVVLLPHDTTQGNTIITNCRIKQDGALTMTNAVYTTFSSLTVPTSPTGAISRQAHDYNGTGPVFRTGTGLAFQMLAAAVAGLTISGSIEVSEWEVTPGQLDAVQ